MEIVAEPVELQDVVVEAAEAPPEASPEADVPKSRVRAKAEPKPKALPKPRASRAKAP